MSHVLHFLGAGFLIWVSLPVAAFDAGSIWCPTGVTPRVLGFMVVSPPYSAPQDTQLRACEEWYNASYASIYNPYGYTWGAMTIDPNAPPLLEIDRSTPLYTLVANKPGAPMEL